MIDFILLLLLGIGLLFAYRKHQRHGCGACRKDCRTCHSDLYQDYKKDHDASLNPVKHSAH